MTEDINRRDSIEKLKKKAQKEIIDLSRFPQENPNPIFRVSNKLENYLCKCNREKSY